MTFNQWDVLVAHFPFTDISQGKKRPVLVVSHENYQQGTGHFLAAMITTASRSRWEGDTPIADSAAAGLRKPCLVRLKLFSLATGLEAKIVGALSVRDREVFQKNFHRYVLGV